MSAGRRQCLADIRPPGKQARCARGPLDDRWHRSELPMNATVKSPAPFERHWQTLRLPAGEKRAFDATISDVHCVAPDPPSHGEPDAGSLPTILLGTSPVGTSGIDPDLDLIRLLGAGGMGQVHLARQRSLSRDVAVKTVRTDAGDWAAYALLREGVITGLLEHPGIVPVHALGQDE